MERIKVLQEKYREIVESKKAASIPEHQKAIFERVLDTWNNVYLKETTFSGDLARLGQILIPVYRRAFAALVGKDIVGTQPLSQPNGYIFGMRYFYAGNKDKTNSDGIVLVGGRTDSPLPPYDNQNYQPNTMILVFSSTANRVTHAGTVGANDSAYGSLPGGSEIAAVLPTGTVAKVVYTEDNKALIRVSSADPTDPNNRTAIRAAITAIQNWAGSTGATLIETYNNEAGYLNILKRYSGQLDTLVGEQLQTNIPELALSIDKVSVEAKTRRLRTSYTLEVAQDLKSIHGKDMATELIDIMQYEVAQSIDRLIIDTINGAAVASTYNVKDSSIGRWQAEHFRNAYTEIVRKSNDIARTTLRGPGNFVIGHTDVVTMLEQLPGFVLAPVKGDVDSSTIMNSTGSAFVGTMGGRFNVYRDIFAANKTATIGFKGKSNYETGVVWSPYVPLEIKNTVDPNNANPAIVMLERSAVTPVPFSSDRYYRQINFLSLFA
jgi:hypothetical protein